MALRMIYYSDDATGLLRAVYLLKDTDSTFRDAASTFALANWTSQGEIQVDTASGQFAGWPTTTWLQKP